jgi:hypothetical protein
VCVSWLTFENFYHDMLDSYIEGYSIERMNNDGNYEPGNCTWIPFYKQAGNRRSSKIWEFKNEAIATSKTKIRGVSWDKDRRKWFAAICVAGKQYNLGRYDSIEEAKAAYDRAVKELRYVQT